MSFTFTTLKQAIQDWTENTETTFVNNLNVFIKNAETRILVSTAGPRTSWGADDTVSPLLAIWRTQCYQTGSLQTKCSYHEGFSFGQRWAYEASSPKEGT